MNWGALFRSKIFWLRVLLAVGLICMTFLDPSVTGLKSVMWLISGMLIGRVITDVIWLRASERMFPFLNEVIDWSKVRLIADGGSNHDSRKCGESAIGS